MMKEGKHTLVQLWTKHWKSSQHFAAELENNYWQNIEHPSTKDWLWIVLLQTFMENTLNTRSLGFLCAPISSLGPYPLSCICLLIVRLTVIAVVFLWRMRRKRIFYEFGFMDKTLNICVENIKPPSIWRIDCSRVGGYCYQSTAFCETKWEEP